MDKKENEATEKLTKDFLAVIAEYQSIARSEHVRTAMQNLAKAGYALRRPPFGYSTTETSGLFRITRRGMAMRVVMQEAANGKISTEEFRLRLSILLSGESLDIRSKASIKRIVTNPYYIGLIRCGEELYKGLHEPLITAEEQQKLVELLEK
ncbi:MAG: recombinase family protein [Patescibacteria group bacterium]